MKKEINIYNHDKSIKKHDKAINSVVQLYAYDNTSLIDAFNNITNNCTIYISPRVYTDIENMPIISNKSNIKIIGCGAEIQCKVYSSDTTNGAKFATPFTFTDCENITIDGLKINGGFTINQTCKTTTNHSKLLYITNSSKINISNVFFTGGASNKVPNISGSESCILITGSDNVTFRDCKFNDNYMEGFWIENCTNILIDNLEAINPYTWTTLNVFNCDTVTISKSYTLVKNGTWNDSATLNIYSSNVVIENSVLKGGAGLDFSDESNMLGTQQNNILVIGCLIDAKYGFHISGDSYVNNVKVDKCTINANYGFYYYMYQNRHIQNLKISNNTMNCINGFRCRALGGTPLMENITITRNTINCKTIAESQSFDATLNSYNGGSSGVVFTGTIKVTSGMEEIRNITISDNEIHAEGSFVFIRSDVDYIIKNVIIDNNKCYNHSQYPTIQVERGMFVSNVIGLSIKNNIMNDKRFSNIWKCKNVNIQGNKLYYPNTIQSTIPYFIYSCIGIMITKDNMCDSSLFEHFQGGTTTYVNNFTSYLLKDNLPSTYKNITAN